jgi:hypothetical protein
MLRSITHTLEEVSKLRNSLKGKLLLQPVTGTKEPTSQKAATAAHSMPANKQTVVLA